MKFHPIADLFPMLQDDEMTALVEDIKQNGQLEWIIVDKTSNMIVDGRNRWRACEIACMGPKVDYIDFSDEVAIASYVTSKNVHRRHLTVEQRAFIAAEMASLQFGSNQYVVRSADRPPISQTRAAELMHVGEKTVRRARKLIADASPDVIRAVKEGKKSISAAHDEMVGKKTHESGYRRDRVIISEEKDLIEAMDNGDISPTAAYDELQERIRNLPQPRINKPRKLIPIEDFVREMIRKISSVVRTGRLDAIAENSGDLTDYQKRDTAMALRDMARNMLDKANELWPEGTTTLDVQEYESE